MITLTRSSLPWVPHTWMSGTNPLQTPRAWFWGTDKWAISAALLACGMSRTVGNVLVFGPPLHRGIEWRSLCQSSWDGYSVCSGLFWGKTAQYNEALIMYLSCVHCVWGNTLTLNACCLEVTGHCCFRFISLCPWLPCCAQSHLELSLKFLQEFEADLVPGLISSRLLMKYCCGFRRLIVKVEVVPSERLRTMNDMIRGTESRDMGPCGGFTTQYACMCDYHNLPYREEVAWVRSASCTGIECKIKEKNVKENKWVVDELIDNDKNSNDWIF